MDHDVHGITDVRLDGVSAIYNVHWSSIFSAFGCSLKDFGRDQAMFATKTQLVSRVANTEDTSVLPIKSNRQFKLDRTNLLAKLGKIWGEVPIGLFQHLDLKNGAYGFVGLSDRTMFPIIRPGSIVQIDQNQKKVVQSRWDDEDDRPIYFVELRDEFICSWCEMRDGYLSAVPHPKSKCQVRRFAYPREADIVGRVIGVTEKAKSPAECARMCVKQGMKYSLVADKKVYTLVGHEMDLDKLPVRRPSSRARSTPTM